MRALHVRCCPQRRQVLCEAGTHYSWRDFDDPGPRPIADWGHTSLIAQLVASTPLAAEKNVASGHTYSRVLRPQPGTNSVGNPLVKVSVPHSQTDYDLNNKSALSSAGRRCMSSTPNHPPEPAPRHSVWKEGTKRHLTDSTIIVSRMRPAQRPPPGTAGIALSVPRDPVMPFERVCGFVWAARGVGGVAFFHGSFG